MIRTRGTGLSDMDFFYHVSGPATTTGPRIWELRFFVRGDAEFVDGFVDADGRLVSSTARCLAMALGALDTGRGTLGIGIIPLLVEHQSA